MGDKKDFKFKFTSEIVCPWCGYEHEESYEFFGRHCGDGDETEIECCSCSKSFGGEIHMSVEYSSKITTCPGHEFDLDEFEWVFGSKEELAKKDTIRFKCNVCREAYYSWQFPGSKHARFKEAFTFIGKAAEVMAIRGSVNLEAKP